LNDQRDDRVGFPWHSHRNFRGSSGLRVTSFLTADSFTLSLNLGLFAAVAPVELMKSSPNGATQGAPAVETLLCGKTNP
jgi:hypothetical protein